MKAIGAKNRFILALFLSEALIIEHQLSDIIEDKQDGSFPNDVLCRLCDMSHVDMYGSRPSNFRRS